MLSGQGENNGCRLPQGCSHGIRIFTIAQESACVILEIHRDVRRGSLADKFSVSVDLESRLMRIRVWGFWCGNEALEYERKLSEAMDIMGNLEPWNIIADVRLFPVQPAPVQRVHIELMQKALQKGMDKAANIVGGRLTRIQIEKLAESAWPEKGHFDYFTSEEEAESWLTGGVDECTGRKDKELLQAF